MFFFTVPCLINTAKDCSVMETISLHYSAVVKPASSASVGQCVWLVVKLLCRLVGFFIFFGHLFVCSRVAVASVQLFFNCTCTLQFK